MTSLVKLFQNQDNTIQTPERRKGPRTLLKQVQLMTVNGSVASEMATVSKSGLMALSTRDNGKIIELTEKVNSFTSTEIFTMETG